MAFGVQQIFPIDFNKSAAVGVDIPFTGPTGFGNTIISGSNIQSLNLNTTQTPFKSNFTTAAATKNNLINYFLTNKGERPLNPTFGGGLRDFIFEQITTDNLDFLKERIQEELKQFFPNISIDSLEILREDNTNTITVSLTYNVINTNINDTIEIDFT
tara:strand:+ start:945 stop:1418 length:474 start_codon:yes stop_codon:yes gene_type:complete